MVRRFAALIALATLGLSACTSTPDPQPSSAPSPSVSPSPSALPSPSAAPQTAPPTTPPVLGAIKCKKTVSVNLPRASGVGPAGSLMTTGSSAVALTFDDGPDPVNTPKMLDLLKQCGVKATFCVIGVKAQKFPYLIRRIHREGHTLCNHTLQHNLNLKNGSDAAIAWDLTRTNEIIRAAAPDAPIRYFRNPGGNFNTKVVRIAKGMGMTSIYWHVDPRDWDFKRYGHGQSMVDQVVSSVEQSTRPGSIVLSHDNLKPDTITAYRTLLPWLDARFKLVALPVSPPLPNAA